MSDPEMDTQNKLLAEQNAILGELRDVMSKQNGILEALHDTMERQNSIIDTLMVANSSPAVARAVQRRQAGKPTDVG